MGNVEMGRYNNEDWVSWKQCSDRQNWKLLHELGWESSTTVAWPSQIVHMWVGVLNINFSLAFNSMFHSKGIFYSTRFSPSSPECWEVHPRNKRDWKMCVSWGFLRTDKNCGKSHRCVFSFITQSDLALIFLRNLLLSVSHSLIVMTCTVAEI